MLNRPKVSVIISVYKVTEFQLSRAINSVLNQTFQDFEIILILDKPDNEAIFKVMLKYNEIDSRIKVFRLEKNSGVSVIRNYGVTQSLADYVCFLDDDDEYLPEKLEKQYQMMVNAPELDLTGTYTIWIDNDDKSKQFRIKPYIIDDAIKYYGAIAQTTIMAKKSSFAKYGYYDPIRRYSEDYDFVVKWYIQGAKIDNLKEHLVYYYKYHNINQNCIRQQTWEGILIKLRYRKKLKLQLKHYIRILFYDIPFFILLPYSLILKLVFVKNIIAQRFSNE